MGVKKLKYIKKPEQVWKYKLRSYFNKKNKIS